MKLEAFKSEWYSTADTLQVHTSGSTGTPKNITVSKSRMLASAKITCDFLDLKSGDTALLCLPLDYIAGKMMVVRSIERELKLIEVEPSSNPLKGITEPPVFAAMIPMQVTRTLENPEQKGVLMGIKQLIIGGGAIDASLAEELKSFPNAVWSTYGMTETLSHIALRRLSGEDASLWYTPFQGVGLSLSQQGTLIIDAPSVCAEPLTTNDIAEIKDNGQFRILGRIDNTINTGGIKVQTEEVERLIAESLPVELRNCFAITSKLDTVLGQKIILVTEAELYKEYTILQTAISSLPKYWKPKDIIAVEKLPLTPNGKINRKALLNV